MCDGGVDVGSAGGGAQYNKNKFNANFSNKQIKENFHSSSQQLFQQQEHHHQPSFHQSPLNSTDQQMSPKSSEPLHPPRHVKHPTDTTTNTTTNNNNPFIILLRIPIKIIYLIKRVDTIKSTSISRK